MAVRPLAEADLPQVVDLYWTYMRRRKGTIPQALLALFHELFFVNPFSDSELPSLVYEAPDGRVQGFLGRNVRRMSYCGQTIRVVFGGNLVVHPEFRSGIAAARLVNTFMAGTHDLALTDSANNISKNILQRMGYSVVPALNIHWRRPLLPSHYAIYGLSVARESLALAALRVAAKPFCAIADSIAAKISSSPFRHTKPRLKGEGLDLETLLQCMVEFRKGYSLWPEYNLSSLQWLLGFMESRPARGSLRKILLKDDAGKIAGWYIYYVKPGAVGEVVQIGGDSKSTKDILDHLFWDALEHGVIGLHGVVDSRNTADFSDKGCFFTCRGGWTVASSRDPEIMRSLARGDAFFSRLDGEWCLDPGD
jgi:hypothetical protein